MGLNGQLIISNYWDTTLAEGMIQTYWKKKVDGSLVRVNSLDTFTFCKKENAQVSNEKKHNMPCYESWWYRP